MKVKKRKSYHFGQRIENAAPLLTQIGESIENEQIVGEERSEEGSPQRQIDHVHGAEEAHLIGHDGPVLRQVRVENGERADQQIARAAAAKEVVEGVLEGFAGENDQRQDVEESARHCHAMDSVVDQNFFGFCQQQYGVRFLVCCVHFV